MANTTLSPTGATVHLSGGTPALASALRPSGATVTASGGASALGSGLRPASASAGLSGGSAALSLGLVVAPASAASALSGGTPAVANAGPTPESRVIPVSAWWHAGNITEAEKEYLIAEAASIAARQAC